MDDIVEEENSDDERPVARVDQTSDEESDEEGNDNSFGNQYGGGEKVKLKITVNYQDV